LVVLTLHLGGIPAMTVQNGYLAVDLFFVLSGFVLARAYQASPKGFWALMRVRLIRFYPLYLVGTALGLLAFILSAGVSWRLLGSAALSAVFAPTPFLMPRVLVESGALFPLNGPAWSLFFELAVNAAWFAIRKQLSGRGLLAILACAATALVAVWVTQRSVSGGENWATLLDGAARCFFSFFAGLAIYRVWSTTKVKPAISWWWPAAVSLAVFVAPIPHAVLDPVAVVIVFPALVFAGACAEPPQWAAGICDWLGRASYAIYVLHIPIFGLIMMLVKGSGSFAPLQFPEVIARHISLFTTPVTFVIVIGLSWLLDKYFDTPMRARLTARLVR